VGPFLLGMGWACDLKGKSWFIVHGS